MNDINTYEYIDNDLLLIYRHHVTTYSVTPGARTASEQLHQGIDITWGHGSLGWRGTP